MKNQHKNQPVGPTRTFDGPGGFQVRHLPRAVQERVEHLMRDVEKWSLELQRKNAEDRDVMNLLKWIINRYEWWCYDFQQHIMCTVIRSAFCVVWFCFRKFDMWLFAKMLYPNGADSRGFPRYQDWNQCSSVLAKTSDCEAPCNMKWYGGSWWSLYYDFYSCTWFSPRFQLCSSMLAMKLKMLASHFEIQTQVLDIYTISIYL